MLNVGTCYILEKDDIDNTGSVNGKVRWDWSSMKEVQSCYCHAGLISSKFHEMVAIKGDIGPEHLRLEGTIEHEEKEQKDKHKRKKPKKSVYDEVNDLIELLMTEPGHRKLFNTIKKGLSRTRVVRRPPPPLRDADDDHQNGAA